MKPQGDHTAAKNAVKKTAGEHPGHIPRATTPQLLGAQIHCGCADPCHSGGHGKHPHGHDQLQKSHACRADPAGYVDLKGRGDHPEQKIHAGEQQGAVKNGHFPMQINHPLSEVYADKGGEMSTSSGHQKEL